MREVLKIFLPIILIALYITYTAFFFGRIEPEEGYPIWMIDANENFTDQTSGLTFVGMKDGKKYFISCDDIGKIHRIIIDERGNEPEIEIIELELSEQVKEYLRYFDKWDFEEIQIDRTNNKLYLAIEGSASKNPNPLLFKEYEGIFELEYNNDLFTVTKITNIRKLELPMTIFEYTRYNIGFEGIGISDKYFFFGLENVRFNDMFFTDSTVIYVCDKNTKEVVSKIYTSEYDIVSICGLYSISDYELLGIDRNMRRVFLMEFNDDMSVKRVSRKDLNMYVPGYPFLNQIVGIAPESITLDNDNNMYIAIDPWRQMYKTDSSSERDVDGGTLDKLKSSLPILFKYKYPF